MCHKTCLLDFDFRNPDAGHFLAMANRAMVAFAALHFESDFLHTPEMFDNIGYDSGIGNCRRTNGQPVVGRDEQNAVEGDRFAGLGFQAVDFKRFTWSDAVLLSTGF
jgi:hypothetical protein